MWGFIGVAGKVELAIFSVYFAIDDQSVSSTGWPFLTTVG
jgi:hypothetical protein